MKRILCILLFLSLAAFAQDCPIQMRDGHMGNRALSFKALNTTQKTIVGMKFRFTMMNELNEPTVIDRAKTSDRRIRPGQEPKLVWDVAYEYRYYGSKTFGATVNLVKVIFDDGTTWEEKDVPCVVHTKTYK